MEDKGDAIADRLCEIMNGACGDPVMASTVFAIADAVRKRGYTVMPIEMSNWLIQLDEIVGRLMAKSGSFGELKRHLKERPTTE